jgi:hypothetical protein
MRTYDSQSGAYLAGRGGTIARVLVWIEARNRTTNAVEGMGLWTGEDHLSLVVEGQARTYLGAGGLLQPDVLTAGGGVAVREYRVGLAAVAPEVENLVLGYDTRFAPVTIHRALLSVQTRELIGTPHRVFKGMVNSVDFPEVPAGEAAACILGCVSETRALTRTLPLKKSDESHQLRGGDRFRRYADVSGSVPVFWGERRAELGVPAPAPPTPRVDPGR